ncbi:hypothetical protein [Sporosarcina sp. FSL W7-1283]|uniref:hypothetical protein n=1 Tax=Sporosarcina sp. FSL W7-1283 TaxID=2921560 RepID=UPI0030FB5995
MTNAYVNTLDENVQVKVKAMIRKALVIEGYEGSELEEYIEDAMCSRLNNLNDLINIDSILK